MQSPAPDDRIAVFHEYRPLLFSIAYRVLGSASTAEDVVQDAFLRWQRADMAEVRSPKDYLGTTVTRLAVDHLRSAHARREVYVGQWLPEPLVGVDANDPLAATMLAESLSTAFLVILERLTPTQRAAFVLREVFSFEFAEIARILQTSEANARQLVQRAKQHITAERPRFDASTEHAEVLTRRFLTSCMTGDMEGLLGVLAEDAVAVADGGGKFSTARRPVTGADRVGRYVAAVVSKWRAWGELRVAPVNGGVGLLVYAGGRLRGVMTTAATETGRIDRVFIMMNPDKLAAPTPAKR